MVKFGTNIYFPYNTRMANKKQPTSPKRRELHISMLKQMITLATSGFGLISALAWNNVIQEFVNTSIKPFIPGGGLISLLIYAILITILAVTVTYQLGRLVEKLKE